MSAWTPGEAAARMAERAAAVQTAIVKTVIEGGHLIEGEAKENITRWAETGPPPSNPDAKHGLLIDTGAMRGNIEVHEPEVVPGGVHVDVEAGQEYGPHHEFGAPAANIPARPFMRPAVESTQASREAIHAKNVGVALRLGGSL